ncbi:MAG: hypothetical protein EOO63_05330 [Hymenobacter sp.]|nr:MAG: hypothetical protein EOO63_05330 [Hymenobacter sp.]
MKQAFALLGLLAAASCSSPSAPVATSPTATTQAAASALPAADSVQQAVTTYIKANATNFTGYEPVRWSRPTPYTKMSEAAIKGVVAMQLFDEALVPRNKALDAYKASLARHDSPAKTEAIKGRYGKANKYNDSLLAIANTFIGVKDTTRLGTEIMHTYRTKAKSGVMVLDSATFVVYTTGKVEQL